MKKIASALSTFMLFATLWSCSNNSSGDNATSDTSGTNTNTTGINDTAGTNANNSGTNNTTGTGNFSATPLKGQDSVFVMDAAMSGMMEVEAGRLAEQNATNPRIKEFGTMMVRDHTTANNELKSLASAKGMMLPDTLSGKMRAHVEAMRKMTGKNFDQHYITMMRTAHTTDISKFEKTSNSGTDADLKAWAAKQLPVLRMHKDSSNAISNMKK